MLDGTYSGLLASIAAWLHRADLTAQIPEFIALAESRMSADIDARPMESRATLAVTAGNAYVTLPPDMLEMRRLMLNGDPVRVLTYASPDEIASDYPASLQGTPAAFAVIGTQLQLGPIPSADGTLELTYLQRIPAVSNAVPTNWLLTGFPNAYLYGALCAAQPFMLDDARTALFEKLYTEAIAAINSIDWYSGTTLRVRAR